MLKNRFQSLAKISKEQKMKIKKISVHAYDQPLSNRLRLAAKNQTKMVNK